MLLCYKRHEAIWGETLCVPERPKLGLFHSIVEEFDFTRPFFYAFLFTPPKVELFGNGK